MIEEELELEAEYFLWPENVPAFNLWLSIQSQWKWTAIPTGGGGVIPHRTGLDYPGVDMCIRYMDVPKKDKRWYFTAMQAMERAALDEWSKER